MAGLNPMDRENLGQTGFETDQGFSLDKPTDPLEQQVGADDDLQRGLERVAALEAWLSAGREHADVLNAFGDSQKDELSHQPTNRQGIGVPQGPDRTLVVIDSRLSNWQQVADALPTDADLLLLDERRSGLQQVEEAALGAKRDGSPYRAVALLSSKAENGDIQLGNDNFSGKETSDINLRLAGLKTEALGNAELKLFSDSAIDSAEAGSEQGVNKKRVQTKLGVEATNALYAAKSTLIEARSDGRAQDAIRNSYFARNQAKVTKKLDALIEGEAAPLIRWASFDDTNVKGAFIANTNTILINEGLKGLNDEIQKVVLEEIGHWLETELTVDSAGDEGDTFATRLLSMSEKNAGENDQAVLTINGVDYLAELSTPSDSEGEENLISRKLENVFDITSVSYENDSSGRKIRMSFTRSVDINESDLKDHFELQINGQSLTQELVHFSDAYLLDNRQTLVLEVNDELPIFHNDPQLFLNTRIAYADISGSRIETTANGSILRLKQDSWSISHPRIFGSQGTELTFETSHRGPSIDIDGRQITIWSTDALDTTAAHSNLDESNFAVYSGRENDANTQATKTHIS